MPSQVSFTLPGSEYQAEADRIARQKRMAEALQQDALQPLAMPSQPGVHVSPLEGMAKLLKAWGGMKGQKRAEEEQKALAGQIQERRGADMSALVGALRGRQAAPAGLSEDASGNITQTDPISALTPSQALQQALPMIQTPEIQQAGMTAMVQALKDERPKEAKWQVTERFNEKTGRQEKVLVDLNNPSNVQPFGGQEATKLEFVNQGGDIQPRDPFSGAPVGTAIQRTVGPEFNAISATDRRRLGNDDARLGMEGQRLWWETGQAPRMGGSNMGAPAAPATPAPSAPAAPAAPGGPGPIPASFSPPAVAPAAPPGAATAPNLPPRAAAQVAADVEKNRLELQNKRDFNMGGINDVLNEAEAILKGTAGPVADGKRGATPLPTQSTTGAIADWTASLVGRAPDGAAQADQLKALAGALTAKMPRMEGPQSDKDVMMYREMAGQIGDNTLPISRRLAALDTVRRIFAKYERGQPQTPAAPAPAAPRPRARNPQTGQEVEWDGSKWVPVSLSVEAEQPQMPLGA